MEEEIEYNEGAGSKNGFVMINNNFLDYWSGIIGPGPSVLYMDLLSYCYGKKIHAWPSVRTLAEDLGITKNSVRKYREVLIKFGLIKKMYKRKLPDGNYQTNVYEIVRSEDLPYPEQNRKENA
ncbi:MAG: helix-turn-helix domain-containing protein [Atribacterota bacterium]